MNLYNTRYYDVIMTEAKIEGEDTKIPVYGIQNIKTGVIEEKVKNLPTAIEICNELTEYLEEHYKKQSGGSNVSAINGFKPTIQ